jgi:Leucine-rich repeat (LRR) protein
MLARRIFMIILIVEMTIWGHYSCSPDTRANVSGQVVNFPDGNLETAIRAVIDKHRGNIYTSDLEQITSLVAREKYIRDISGLEYCSNLMELDLSHNNISDISPLVPITNLRNLNLRDNPLSDISSLSSLTNLTELNLAFTQSSDISILSLRWYPFLGQ